MSEIIEESLVQWVLLKRPEHLSNILQLKLGKCLGTELTTKFGRVDFMFDLNNKELLIIELETNIDSSAKYQHCTSQIQRYLKLKNTFRGKKVKVALVYGSENTSEQMVGKLSQFASDHGVIIREYSIQKIIKLYNETVNQLNYTSGVSLGRAVALGITSLTWLKKFMAAFLINDAQNQYEDGSISIQDFWSEQSIQDLLLLDAYDVDLSSGIRLKDLKRLFTSTTNFYVLKRLAEDFELIHSGKSGKSKGKSQFKVVTPTSTGVRFCEELILEFRLKNYGISDNYSKELTKNQSTILLEVLVNGNFTKLKVNIFHFLRYIHLTEGSWLLKQGSKLSAAERQFLNGAFRSSYNAKNGRY